MIDPTLSELIRRAVDSRVADIHVAIPAEVQSYDAVKQTAVVLPMVRNVIEGDTDDLWEEDFQPIPNVPIEWPGGGGFYLHFPLVRGDTGLLTFCERSIAEWRATGKMSTPGDLRLHGLGAGVFRPGLRSNKTPRTDAPATGVAVLAVGPGILRIGEEPGSEFVAMAGKVEAALGALKELLTTTWVPVPNDGGAALKVAAGTALADWPAPVGATKLKVK